MAAIFFKNKKLKHPTVSTLATMAVSMLMLNIVQCTCTYKASAMFLLFLLFLRCFCAHLCKRLQLLLMRSLRNRYTFSRKKCQKSTDKKNYTNKIYILYACTYLNSTSTNTHQHTGAQPNEEKWQEK